jgi:hypothetical protein
MRIFCCAQTGGVPVISSISRAAGKIFLVIENSSSIELLDACQHRYLQTLNQAFRGLANSESHAR